LIGILLSPNPDKPEVKKILVRAKNTKIFSVLPLRALRLCMRKTKFINILKLDDENGKK